MRAPTQLHLSNVTFERPDEVILRDVSLTVGPGDRIGLTGPNGAGKSTLLALAAQVLVPSSGAVAVVPSAATVGLLRQEVQPESGESARAFIERQLGIEAASSELERATGELANRAGEQTKAADRYDAALQHWLGLGAASIDERLPQVMSDLGLDPVKASQPVETLSGGEQGRVGLASVLLAEFDVLLLDEPTNNLDLAGLDILEAHLGRSTRPYVVVSHDRRFLERTVSSVLELDAHHRTIRRFEGGWQAFQEERSIEAAHARRRFDDYEQTKHRLNERAQTERLWATKGVARAKNNMPDNDKVQRNFRVEASENLAGKARRTERAIERLDVVEKPWEPWRLQFCFGAAARSGDLVVALDQAVVARGGFELGPVTLEVNGGDRVRIAGPNGAGKTTLIEAMFGNQELRSGSRRIGPSVTVGVLDQRRALGRRAATLLDAVEEVSGSSLVECRNTLAKFSLGSAHVNRSITELSPGERTRANLAIFQLRGVNTVVLDEPTNHLDIEAIEQLESALAEFEGTLIVVTHDRAFGDNLQITSTIELG